MLRKTLLTLLAIFSVSASGFAAAKDTSIGVVNFNSCMTDSKMGKQEQSSFESLKKQMASLLEDNEKQLGELATKFNDPDYMDGLSPEAEEEMQNKYRTLSEEMNRYQNQYYQVMNQANMKIIQTMGKSIQEASQKVASDKKLAMVLNKEACFYYTPTLDVTNLVIAELDRTFDATQSKVASGSNPKK